MPLIMSRVVYRSDSPIGAQLFRSSLLSTAITNQVPRNGGGMDCGQSAFRGAAWGKVLFGRQNRIAGTRLTRYFFGAYGPTSGLPWVFFSGPSSSVTPRSMMAVSRPFWKQVKSGRPSHAKGPHSRLPAPSAASCTMFTNRSYWQIPGSDADPSLLPSRAIDNEQDQQQTQAIFDDY